VPETRNTPNKLRDTLLGVLPGAAIGFLMPTVIGLLAAPLVGAGWGTIIRKRRQTAMLAILGYVIGDVLAINVLHVVIIR
jgi:hypothetical protein